MFKYKIKDKVKISSLLKKGLIIKRQYRETNDDILISYDIKIKNEGILENIPERSLEKVVNVKSKSDTNIVPFHFFKENCPNRDKGLDNSKLFDTCLHYYKLTDLNDEVIDCEEINCPHYHFYKIIYKCHLTNE